MILQTGARLGPYEIVAPLGSGGMGEVYRARDTRLGRDVAVKVLQDTSREHESWSRFEREARAASALTAGRAGARSSAKATPDSRARGA